MFICEIVIQTHIHYKCYSHILLYDFMKFVVWMKVGKIAQNYVMLGFL